MRLRNNVLAQYFPEADLLYPRGGQTDDMVLSVVEHCLDPRLMAQLEFDAFVQLVTRRKVTTAQEKRLRQLWKAAKTSVGCPVHDAARWEAKSLVNQLRALREIIKDNDHRMETVAQRFPEYESLLSIPGFGPTVSAMVLAAIGNPGRFIHRQQVLRLAGLDLTAERSGNNSDTAIPVISKQGKAALRYALVQAATVASLLNPTVRRYYEGLLHGRELERGIKLKMRVKLAAKLLVIAWTLMKRREKFDSSCFNG